MPRTKRRKSVSGFYHIYNRGNNKMVIFEQDSDYKMFLKLSKSKSIKYNIHICSYVLMPNHFHLVIKDNNNNISSFMISLSTSYVRYFNARYNRTGSLYEGRYKHRCIENEHYLRIIIRYIHRNPEVAKLNKIANYKYSSYNEYFLNNEKFCNSTYMKKLFPDTSTYKAFMEIDKYDKQQDEVLKQENTNDISELTHKANTILYPINCVNVQRLNTNLRNKALIQLYKQGIAPYHIQKLTGISKSIIFKAIRFSS